MKILVVLLIMGLSSQAWANTNIIQHKDWRADITDSAKSTSKAACVAQTTIKDTDTTLQVYAEVSPEGGYVEPTVQIVTTDIQPALGVSMLVSPGSRRLPMSIALGETRVVQKEVPGEEEGEVVMQDVEQQVFIIKFMNKKEMIKLIKAKNSITGTFYDAAGELQKMKFSLRGSHRSVSKMVEACR